MLAGKEAADLIDKSMREADKSEKHFDEIYDSYTRTVQSAQGLSKDDKRRGEQINIARRTVA